ncbi:hypothetical protein DPMN_164116 [Dreissena polymorpha]|uniref:Uncharacterized protein n=1 Tax=Dreissena polymorpha TaxID=45954 RepID=A0A9D4EY24_DREPO|nr:hypothetical protein DPMN_164116 [Dreissena polymorpha]
MFQYASILGLGDMMDFINIVIEDVRDELLSSFQLSDNRLSFFSSTSQWKICE